MNLLQNKFYASSWLITKIILSESSLNLRTRRPPTGVMIPDAV